MKSWWRAVVAYPATWLAIGFVVLATWAVLSLLQPPFFMTLILLVLAGLAIVAWPITMSATGTLNRLQFEVPKLPEIEPEELSQLAEELQALDDARPAYQLNALQEKRDSLVGVLNSRLEAGEITYARYLSSAQRVYLAALENLREVAVAEQSVSAIDDDYIGRRLEDLVDQEDAAAITERTSLEDRRSLRKTQEKKVASLLAQNETAMTVLDRTATALADASIGRKPQGAQAAMKDLQEMADRAGKYAV
jgi:hypothetical protein